MPSKVNIEVFTDFDGTLSIEGKAAFLGVIKTDVCN